MSVAQARGPGVAEELLERWQHFVEAMFARMQPQIENLDGDPLLWTRDHFALDPARRAEVITRLLALERAETDEDGTTTHVTLFEPREEMPSRFGPAMVARVVVKECTLVLETNSVRRADAARARVEETLKELGLLEAIRHRLRDHEDIAVQAEPPFVSPISPRTSPPADLFRTFEESHWRSWIDTPLPMLRGISPREASKTKSGRVMLVRFIDEMEREEKSSPRGLTSDYGALRRALGV